MNVDGAFNDSGRKDIKPPKAIIKKKYVFLCPSSLHSFKEAL